MTSRFSPTGLSSIPAGSRNIYPIAEAIPMPASLVALPPIPRIILSAPLLMASLIISPVPSVVVYRGFCFSLGTSLNPEAADISINAVLILSA